MQHWLSGGKEDVKTKRKTTRTAPDACYSNAKYLINLLPAIMCKTDQMLPELGVKKSKKIF